MVLRRRAALLALAGLVPLLVWPSSATVRWWLLGVFVLCALDVALTPSPSSLSLQRVIARAHVRVGEVTPVQVRITNPSGRAVTGVLRDAWPPSAGAVAPRHTVRLRAGERTQVTTMLAPTRRGDRIADRVTLRLFGPLRLAGRQRSFEFPGVVRALHPFPARKHLPSRLAVLRQLDGRAALRVRGQGTEFDSLRDYVEGDDVRSIDWRATARRRALVVRTWRPEEHRRVIIIIDTSRTSAGRIGDAPRLDAAMDSALLLTALAGHARDRVQVIAGDRVVHARIQGHERATLLHDTISRLAPVHPQLIEADWPMLAREVGARAPQRALVVLLTNLEPAAIEEGLLPVLPTLTTHHRVVVASVADPLLDQLRQGGSSTSAVYDAAAAERSMALRDRAGAAIRALGADVIDATSTDLPVRLADHYLALKRAGQL